MKNICLSLLLILSCFRLMAQDTLYRFSEKQCIQLVKTFHPLAKQAQLDVAIQAAEQRKARAAFDPVLDASKGQKILGGSNYYEYQTWNIDIPTWYGIELEAGQEQFNGDRLSNERTSGNLSYAGISFSVLQNLMIDKRRAYLKQAGILLDQSRFEQNNAINDLLYEALQAYWEWAQAYAEREVIQKGMKNAEQRLVFTRQQVMIGERAGIDSVEAQVQFQYFQQQNYEAEWRLQQARYVLSAFLWQDDKTPYVLPNNIQPEFPASSPAIISNNLEQEDFFLNELFDTHPALNAYQQKINYWQVSRQLARQELLPKLDVQYRFLNKKNNAVFSEAFPLLNNNFQYGVKFNMPLRLSEGRADVRITKLKQEQTRFDLYNKQQLLANKVKANYTGVKVLAAQWQLQQDLVSNQLKLQTGEEIRFQQGESSLFLMNSREQKTIEAQQKEAAIKAKFYKQKASLMWSAGLLYAL
ncbi:MAG: TolC family protein [Chitinophagaceae bacterium]